MGQRSNGSGKGPIRIYIYMYILYNMIYIYMYISIYIYNIWRVSHGKCPAKHGADDQGSDAIIPSARQPSRLTCLKESHRSTILATQLSHIYIFNNSSNNNIIYILVIYHIYIYTYNNSN